MKRHTRSELYLLRKWRNDSIRQQKNLCFWCHVEMTAPERNEPTSASADHKIPTAVGGMTVRSNIVAACRKCNSERNWELHSTPDDGAAYASAGDDTPLSPFEILQRRT